MQATEYRPSNNLTVRLSGELWGTGDALVEALVRSRLIEISDIIGHDAPQMAFTQGMRSGGWKKDALMV